MTKQIAARKVNRAFTLIELLIVVAIISVMVALLLPTIYKARSMARTVICAANLRQIGAAFGAYKASYHNYLPPVDAFVSHMPGGTDWALPKDYGMWNALGEFVGLPEWGGVKDPASAPAGTPDDAYTGYEKWGSYWGGNAAGGKKFRKSIFLCPETRNYGDNNVGPFAGSGYGESTYLQKYPSGPARYNVPSTGGNGGATTGYGLPRPASCIKNPGMAIAVSDKGGDNHSLASKMLPAISDLTFANYPPSDRGSPYNDFDLYRHNGGCNILFADGHVAYYKGTDVLNNIVHDPDSKSMRNYNLP